MRYTHWLKADQGRKFITADVETFLSTSTVWDDQAKPVATLIRKRAYENGPAWTSYDLNGVKLCDHTFIGAGTLGRIARKLNLV